MISVLVGLKLWCGRLVNIHFREGVVLLFFYEWDGLILKNFVLELSFFVNVPSFSLYPSQSFALN